MMCKQMYANVAHFVQSGAGIMQKRKPQLFPTVLFVEFVTIDILGPLPTTSARNLHVVIGTEQFSKLKEAILSARLNSMEIGKLLSKN